MVINLDHTGVKQFTFINSTRFQSDSETFTGCYWKEKPFCFFLVLFDIYLPTCSVHNILYLTYFAIFNIFFIQFEVKKQKLKKQRKVNADQLCLN